MEPTPLASVEFEGSLKTNPGRFEAKLQSQAGDAVRHEEGRVRRAPPGRQRRLHARRLSPGHRAQRRKPDVRPAGQALGPELPARRPRPARRLQRPQRLRRQAEPQPPLAHRERHRVAQLRADRRAAGDLLGDLPPAVPQHRRHLRLVRRRLRVGRPPAPLGLRREDGTEIAQFLRSTGQVGLDLGLPFGRLRRAARRLPAPDDVDHADAAVGGHGPARRRPRSGRRTACACAASSTSWTTSTSRPAATACRRGRGRHAAAAAQRAHGARLARGDGGRHLRAQHLRAARRGEDVGRERAAGRRPVHAGRLPAALGLPARPALRQRGAVRPR